MTNSEKRYYNKKFAPKYMRGLAVAVPAVILTLVLAFFAAVIISAFVVPELNLTGKIFIIFIITLLVALIVLIALTVAFNKKLVAQRKKELEEEFTQMTLEEATAQLLARGVITENGFIVPNLVGSGEIVPIVPFRDVTVYFYSANVCTKILTAVSICDAEGNIMAEYLVDRALYNYLEKSNFKVEFYGGSEMLFGEKGAFVKRVIKTRNSKGIGFTVMFGAIGAAIAEHAKNDTIEMQVVLRVLNKENI